MGSAYVNDFNMFGRTYRVTAQADGGFRLDPENVARIRVRNADGQMVPLGSLVTFKQIAGPERVPRYNLFPTVEIQGRRRPRHLVGPGARADDAGRRADAAGGRRFRVDGSFLPGKAGGPDRLLHLRAVGAVRVPGAGRAVRELVAAARHHPDRADVLARRHFRRVVARSRHQHPDADRLRGVDRLGRQERHSDRRVRKATRGARQGRGYGGGRGLPHAAEADPDDVARLHARRGAALFGRLVRARRCASRSASPCSGA